MPHSPAQPALPLEDLAHNRTKPLHWFATATAMAAVVAAAGLVQPSAGAAASASAANGPQDPAPDPRALTYPLDCGSAPQAVTATAQGDLDGDGRPETVAAVRCDAGSGTPPHAIYVLTQDASGPNGAARPRVVATLLDTTRHQTATDLTVRDGIITVSLLGYSSPEVPRYSPDIKQLAKWRWSDGKFRQELTDSAARGV